VEKGINGGEVLNLGVGIAAEGEIIMEEVAPNVIEEELGLSISLPDQPVQDLPVENVDVVQALQAPMNWLVEEIPEDMLMGDAELALEGNAAATDQEANHQPAQLPPQDNLQLGMVEIFYAHSVDLGVAHFLSSRAPVPQNAEAIHIWAQHFKELSNSRPIDSIPSEWSNFFTSQLL